MEDFDFPTDDELFAVTTDPDRRRRPLTALGIFNKYQQHLLDIPKTLLQTLYRAVEHEDKQSPQRAMYQTALSELSEAALRKRDEASQLLHNLPALYPSVHPLLQEARTEGLPPMQAAHKVHYYKASSGVQPPTNAPDRPAVLHVQPPSSALVPYTASTAGQPLPPQYTATTHAAKCQDCQRLKKQLAVLGKLLQPKKAVPAKAAGKMMANGKFAKLGGKQSVNKQGKK